MVVKIHSSSLNFNVPRAASIPANAAQTVRQGAVFAFVNSKATTTDASTLIPPAEPLPRTDILNLRIRTALNAYIDLANNAAHPINPRIDEFV